MRGVVALAATAACGRIAFDGTDQVPLVSGGTFYRSYDVGSDGAFPDTSFPATVSDFRLDRYEVTVARFRAFVAAGAGTQLRPPADGDGAHPQIAASGWQSAWNAQLPADSAALRAQIACGDPYTLWSDAPADHEQQPMNCLTWYEAMAFCAWDGGFLPTETEWDYASAGGAEQRAYPWAQPASDLTVDETFASYYVDGTLQCGGDNSPGCGPTDILAVGSRPKGDGRWGQSDLGGNLWEWNLDYLDTYAPTCVDCANLTPTGYRSLRGGCFHVAELNLRSGFRQGLDPSTVPFDTGVRCARVP